MLWRSGGPAGRQAGPRQAHPQDEDGGETRATEEGAGLMCGIIGIIGKGAVTPLLVDALRRLEYRGYDSAGVATLIGGRIERRRAEGKLDNLVQRLTAATEEGRAHNGLP